nr:MAG TPA: hypothetical protein [Caudoviricetes sp.]
MIYSDLFTQCSTSIYSFYIIIIFDFAEKIN